MTVPALLDRYHLEPRLYVVAVLEQRGIEEHLEVLVEMARQWRVLLVCARPFEGQLPRSVVWVNELKATEVTQCLRQAALVVTDSPNRKRQARRLGVNCLDLREGTAPEEWIPAFERTLHWRPRA